ncbi:NAD-dependent epimerase/dehydratase family protein [Aureisphaera galaxeae]|uniref:NAD-dependent epimerase/dehydratase family protein n=1 Tax=Aureisphaera galaxeae TaxID=1538023 RepID=UPI00235032DB|nr:NAD-dependent epimerase/dehydratase family protein [Aureisphaera galaxeae]MDC8002787.1 NAD-dependent epimerase/dehydratase family protein [Aureisphaera galaxeae]
MILVTGGTGMVGAHLLLQLTQNGQKVRATHRKDSNLKRVEEIFAYFTPEASQLFKTIEWVVADITDLPAMEIAFQGVTQVFHCAAYISFRTHDYQKLKSINNNGTANVVNLCLSHKVDYLCYVSSIATLGTPIDGATANEDSHWNPEENNNVYAISKYGAEMHVWRATQEGLKAVIVNPGVILGEGNWNSGSGRIFKKASKGMKHYTSGGSGFVDVKDVVSSMLALTEKQITNQRYILVGHNATYRELLQLLMKGFSLPEPKKSVSKRTLTWLSYLDGFVSFLLGKHRRLTKESVASLTTVSTFSSEKIKQQLGMKFTPLEETISRVAKNYSSSS